MIQMGSHVFFAPILAGFAALLLGLVPGLIERVMQAILEFGATFTLAPTTDYPAPPTEDHRKWFTAVGLAVIVVGTIASLIG